MGAQELPSEVFALVRRCGAEGDGLADSGRYDEAVAAYNRGWVALPEPKNQWAAATWLLAAIGEACFLGGHLGSARQAFDYAMTCPGAVGNPFLHLRRGQVALDQGEPDVAADELVRAYMGGGREIFEREDGRYLAFLATRVEL